MVKHGSDSIMLLGCFSGAVTGIFRFYGKVGGATSRTILKKFDVVFAVKCDFRSD